MSYATALDPALEQSGTFLASSDIEEGFSAKPRTAWLDIWSKSLHTQAAGQLPQGTGSWFVYIAIEAVPCSSMNSAMTTKERLATIEIAFGRSATHLAQMLGVSRPMIYHYRKGMEPSAENNRRLMALAEFARDWVSQIDRSLEIELKTIQPDGRSLLDLLADTELDFVALRRAISRSLEGRRKDEELRRQVADELTREETVEARRDIMRDRHASGKPVYTGDPDNPGKLIQLLPNGRRIRGQMINRKFVPDGKWKTLSGE